jgi:ribose/xylose/arabinose/galactoside ABC-type transport system permease subunit
VPQPIQQMAVGVIIIVAVWLDGILRRSRRASKVAGR